MAEGLINYALQRRGSAMFAWIRHHDFACWFLSKFKTLQICFKTILFIGIEDTQKGSRSFFRLEVITSCFTGL